MTWSGVADVIAAAMLLSGSLLALIASIGILRFPDVLSRLHAGSKPQVLGLVLVLSAEALRIRNMPVLGMLIVIVLFQFLTVPVSAHLIARAGYRTGHMRSDLLVVDELTRDQAAATQQKFNGEPSGNIPQEPGRVKGHP